MDVNSASMKGIALPARLATGSESNSAPSRMMPAKPSAMICIEFNLILPNNFIFVCLPLQVHHNLRCGRVASQNDQNFCLFEYILIGHIITFCHCMNAGLIPLCRQACQQVIFVVS